MNLHSIKSIGTVLVSALLIALAGCTAPATNEPAGATLDPESRPGMEGANRKIKGTIHWVSARHAVAAEVRLYDRLFSVPDPDDDTGGKTYQDHLNPDSRRSVTAYVEPSTAEAAPEQHFQFERLGYFVADRRDHRSDAPVFNRSVTLRDTWAGKA